jgi:hypothetical protein
MGAMQSCRRLADAVEKGGNYGGWGRLIQFL